MQTCFQNQQVWPCAVLKYYASWGCAVRWPGFNCPWDTLIFTWLTVTLCRAGPAGGGITLVGTWKALAARWTVKAKSVCMLQTTHAFMHVFAVQKQHYLFSHVARAQVHMQSHVLMFVNFRDNSIRGMDWDLLFSLWKRPICLCQGANCLFLMSSPSASPEFIFWGLLLWQSSIDSEAFHTVMSSSCLMEGQNLSKWSWSVSAKGNPLRLAKNMN